MKQNNLKRGKHLPYSKGNFGWLFGGKRANKNQCIKSWNLQRIF